MQKYVDISAAIIYNNKCRMTQPKQNNEAWLSLVERCVRDAEVACSNHVASTFSRSIGNVKFPVLFFLPKNKDLSIEKPHLSQYKYSDKQCKYRNSTAENHKLPCKLFICSRLLGHDIA